MMNDKDFINGVWQKYDNYINSKNDESFFKKNHYKNNKLVKNLNTAISFIVGLVATTGIVYASAKTYEFIQKSTSTDFDSHLGYDYNQDMLYSNGLYYKKIYSYEDYIEAQKMWQNLVDMEEKDFQDYFVLILAGENYDTTSLYISDISADEQKIYIDLKKKDVWTENDTVISSKISKNLDRENVEIHNLPNIPAVSSKYTDIKQLDENYTDENAINDGCFVFNQNHILSDNQQQLDNLINICNEGQECIFRIYNHDYDGTKTVYDVESKNNRINICWRIISQNNSEVNYRTGNRISKSIASLSNDGKNDFIDYTLLDEMGNQMILCAIHL